MKKRILIFVLALCMLVLPACTSSPTVEPFQYNEHTTVTLPSIGMQTGQQTQQQGGQQTTQTTVDRLPNLSAAYDSHQLLKNKGFGACHTMTGDVMITMLMVEDDKSVWTSSALEDYKQQQATATQKLLKEAKDYGATLNLTVRYQTCRVTGTVSMDDYQDWVDAALAAAKLPAQNEVSPYLEKLYGVKEAPVFFCVNYSGRAFSIPWNQGDYFEYGILYTESADYRHELNHLFGACDFYSPAIVKQLSDKYLPNSIMTDSTTQVTDHLTAYLIGWTDTLSANAKAFVEETAFLTQEYLSEQLEQETLTGYGTKRMGDGTYTGYMVTGTPHGQGKMVWDNGNVYEGNWKDGLINGQGKMVWNNGDLYEGNWKDGQYNGQGKVQWSNGDVYEGEWQNGLYHGQGKLRWKDGNTYEGAFQNGSANGYGVMHWRTDNCSYAGEWVNWQMHGYGTFTYADGTTRTGRWDNGNFVGE